MDLVTGALGMLQSKLLELLKDEYNLQTGVKEEISSLTRELESAKAALSKVRELPPDQLEEQVRNWAREVREASYDMEDVLDTFLVRLHDHDKPTNMNWVERTIKSIADLFRRVKVRHEIGGAIQDIRKQLQEAAEQRARYKIEILANKPAATSIDPRLQALYTKASELVGIEKPRKELKEMLNIGDNRIVSIFGFGGLGKTTLAKTVYDDLTDDVQFKAFVPVGRNPQLNKVLKDILIGLDKERYMMLFNLTILDERQLIDELRDFLINKRFFIVIDDIWDVPSWNTIKCALDDNGMRSKIVITTRNNVFAQSVGCSYKMKPMSYESSTTLFYGRIFGSKEKCPEKYSEVSEKIINKCGGVPLAIIATSSLLANNLGNIQMWNKWCDFIGSGLGKDHYIDDMRKILSFSYYDLPSELKTCLLYLSTFPEDCLILKDRLIRRWIAEGFVQLQHGEVGQSLYDIGQSYFVELLNRSLIQPAYADEDIISPTRCRVHDMVLDVICSLSREEECFVTTVLRDCKQITSSTKCKVRRLSIHGTTYPTMNMSKLRSLTIFNPSAITSIPPLSFCHLLRVLDLEDCNLSSHPNLEFVGNLVHLRYLCLLNTRYAGEVPEEIGKLQFLQMLDLGGTQIKELPSSIVKVRRLMCLGVGEFIRLPNRLRNLMSLESIVTHNVDSTYIAEELGHLTQLRKLVVCLRKDAEGRWDQSMCTTLVGSIGKLHKIEVLAVACVGVLADLEGSVNSLGNLRRLQMINISVMPTWIQPGLLVVLSNMHISVSQVRREDIQVLGLLPALRFLRVEATGTQVGEKYMVSADAFQCAATCIFDGFSMPPSVFPPGAMPKLERYEFYIRMEDFCSGEYSLYTPDDLALGHLRSLQSVVVDLCGESSANEEAAMMVKEKLMHEVSVHPNNPRIGRRKRSITLQ